MKTASRGTEIAVGVVTLSAVALLVLGIIWAKGIGASVTGRGVSMMFDQASGIKVGTPITLRGIDVGTVNSVQLADEGVRVRGSIRNNIRLMRDARAYVETAELTGGKRIALEPGDATAPLEKGATIDGEIRGDVGRLLQEAGNISRQTSALLQRLDTTVAAINSVVADERLRRSIHASALNLEETSQAARSIVVNNRAAINQTISSLNAAVSDLQRLITASGAKIDRTLEATAGAAESAGRLATRAEGTLAGTDTLLAHVDSLVLNISQVVEAINTGDGIVHRLMYDKEFADELASTLTEVHALVENLRRYGFNLNVRLGSKP